MSLPEIKLRRLRHDDKEERDKLFAWRNDPLVFSWCRQFDSLHLVKHEKWLVDQANDPKISMYGITSGICLLGVCGFTDLDLINRRAEFSLYIDPKQAGNHYGEAALHALVKKGFADYGLNCIWGEAFDGNPAIKMFERVGFREEGRRREFYFRDGKFIDAILFSLLRSEYV